MSFVLEHNGSPLCALPDCLCPFNIQNWEILKVSQKWRVARIKATEKKSSLKSSFEIESKLYAVEGTNGSTSD